MSLHPTLTMPASSGRLGLQGRPELAGQRPTKVLVVEDSRSARELIVAFIKRMGHVTIDAVDSLGAAEDALRAAHEPYLCAVVDYGLPDAPHGEAVASIKAHKVPIIVLSASFHPALRVTLGEHGIVDYVLKRQTAELHRLAETVRRLRDNPQYKVLVVDDSKMFREHTAALLRKYAFRTQLACNGQEALDLLNAQSDISLVISDVYMPEMDGFELITAIRQKWSREELPVIGLSDRIKGDVSARLLRSGANDVITKPFAIEEFHCRVLQNLDLYTLVRTLKNLAFVDALTGLPNRRQLFKAGTEHFIASADGASPFGVALFDIDHFKRINDVHGHAIGDAALRAVGLCLATFTDAGGFAARYGGEEFGVVLVAGSADEMLASVERIRSTIEALEFEVDGRRVPITVSGGLVTERGTSFDSMLENADAALYQAKTRGRNRVESFTEWADCAESA